MCGAAFFALPTTQSAVQLSIKDGSTVLRTVSVQNNSGGVAMNVCAVIADATLDVPGGGGATITLVAVLGASPNATATNNTARQYLVCKVVPT
jgi:hypothetical protein